MRISAKTLLFILFQGKRKTARRLPHIQVYSSTVYTIERSENCGTKCLSFKRYTIFSVFFRKCWFDTPPEALMLVSCADPTVTGQSSSLPLPSRNAPTGHSGHSSSLLLSSKIALLLDRCAGGDDAEASRPLASASSLLSCVIGRTRTKNGVVCRSKARKQRAKIVTRVVLL